MNNPFVNLVERLLNNIHYIFGRKGKVVFYVLIGSLVAGIAYGLFLSSPKTYPEDSILTVEEGDGLIEVAENLKKDGIVRSAFWFRNIAILLGGERSVQAGDYYLAQKENILSLAKRIVTGDYNIDSIKVTIPEGFTVKDISNLFDEKFTQFDKERFTTLAREGYMFPDTYHVQVTITAEPFIQTLSENFNLKIASLNKEIEKSNMPIEDIIILASIIESEAKNAEDRRIIAGILFERMERSMPLQVDATLKYITGKTSAELTQDDLKSESLFNTYVHLGLPPSPISNPGLDSIKAVLNPEESEYLYFLTGDDGKMYYAKSFEEHKRNKEKYIR